MNVIVFTNILLSVIISTCTAAGLTDEQLAQIFNEKSDRTDLLPATRDDFTSIRDEVNSLDQTLSLLGETDDTLQTPAEDLTRSSKLRAHACGTSAYGCQKGRRDSPVRNTESPLYQYFKRLQSSRNTKPSTPAVVDHPSNINNDKKAVPSKTLHLADTDRQLDDSTDPLPVSRSDNFRRNQQSDDLKGKSIHVPVCGTDDSECQRGKPLKPKHN